MAISQQMVVKKQVHTPIFSDQVKQQCAVLDIYQNRERTFDFGLSNPALPMSTRLVNTTWYQGFLGSVVMREKSLSVKTLSSRSVRKSLLTEKVMALKIWLLKSEVEIYFGTSLTSVPRALKVYQLVEFDSFIWDMCRNSDLEGFQAAFTNGRLSPFVIDQSGQTLLYVRTSCKLKVVNAEDYPACFDFISTSIVFLLSKIGLRSRSSHNLKRSYPVSQESVDIGVTFHP